MKYTNPFAAPPHLQPFLMEIQSVCLFPEMARDEMLAEVAADWGYTLESVKKFYDHDPCCNEFFRLLWTRMLEPTSKKAHEITPIVARVRSKQATQREIRFLGAYSVSAIIEGDKGALDALHRLAIKEVSSGISHQMYQALFDFFKKHNRIPGNAELGRFIDSAGDPKKYERLNEENWSRDCSASGITPLFRQAKKSSGNSPQKK